MSHEPIIVEAVYKAPVSKVWAAISDKAKMQQWYFNLAEFKPEAGFKFQFSAGEPGKEFVHLCRVTAAEPEKKLAYTWQYENTPGNSEVTFELFDEGAQTRVRLTHTGVESFAASGPDFAKNNFVQGWNAIIGTNLQKYLEAN